MNNPIPTPAVFAGSLARTFEYRTAGVHQTPQVRWTFTPLATVFTPGNISCPVLVDKGIVYVGDDRGSFSALDAQSGEVLWSFQDGFSPNGIIASCLAGDLGYVLTSMGMVYELDLKTGQMVRSWKDGSAGSTNALFLSQGALFLCGCGGKTTRLDLATGQLNDSGWLDATSEYDAWIPSVYHNVVKGNDIIYRFAMASHSGEIIFWAEPLSSTSNIWWCIDYTGEYDEPNRIEEVGALYPCMMPIMDDVLYACRDKDLGLVALDPLTGALRWSYPSYDISQIAAASGLVFLRGEDSIEAVDVQTQKQRWSWDADVDFEIEGEDGEESESDWSWDEDAPAATRHFFVADGLLYVFSSPGQIIALDVQTGETRWVWQMDGAMREHWQATSPDADEDDEEARLDPATFCTIAGGMLYVVAGGTLYALG